MDIRPFRGWHYPGSDVSKTIAPPYDILNQQDKDELLSRSCDNIVGVDLPHVPPKQLGPEEAYVRAAKLLDDWEKSGVLIQEQAPALYAYEQSYTWAGKTYARRAMFAGVRSTPLGEDVIPHEHTFDGPKADRLKLTECTKTQLSPIFGFYNDPIGVTDKLLSAATSEPTISGTLNGVTEKLWVIDDPKTIGEIQTALADVPVYIADGHHRYTTTMNYAKDLREAGKIDADHEANFVLFALVAREDPGLLVLPTHRVADGLADAATAEALCEKLAPAFECKKIDDAPDLSDADAYLSQFGEGAMLVLDGNEMWLIRLVDPKAMLEVAPDECDEWRNLDVAILQELIIDRAMSEWKTDDFSVEYTPDGNIARKTVQNGEAKLAVVMQGTPLGAVEKIANAGASMPHKSTYFYPKIATGMILKPLE
ncbi:MAG: DUF1015 domain-containing protein [Phycisphaerae bacterium]|nr:DUF1015 domain-containing protein [Phycisphaerae bacterium]